MDKKITAFEDKLTIMQLTLGLDLSGQSVYVRNLCVGLHARGHQTIVVTGNRSSGTRHGAEFLEKTGAKVIEMRMPALSNKIKFGFASIRAGKRLARIIDEHQVDILHVHAITLAPAVHAAKLLAKRKVRIYSTFHNEEISAAKLNWGRLGRMMLSHPYGEKVFAISGRMATHLRTKLNVRENQIVQIDSAVDANYFRPGSESQKQAAKAKFAIAPEAFTVTCVGVLTPNKNQGVLLRAAAIARKQVPNIHVLLAGKDSSPYRKHLTDKANELGLADRLIITGETDPLDVYHAADLHVLPSRQEGFGLAVVEAGLCGVPSIRSNAGGVDEQIQEGITGYAIDADDVDTLAQHIITLANDRDKLAALGKAAHDAYRSRFTIARMTQEVLDAYQGSPAPQSAAQPHPTL